MPALHLVRINEAMLQRARDRTKADNSIFDNGPNRDITGIHGMLGEELVSAYYGVNPVNGVGVDFELNNLRIEVKSRSLNTTQVFQHYSCSAGSLSMRCDKYIFCIIHSSLNYGWIVGACDREEFNKKAVYAPRGLRGFELQINQLEEIPVKEA